MVNLGVLYEKGHGGTRDYAKARECYEKATDAGDTDAMYNLGTLYEEQLGSSGTTSKPAHGTRRLPTPATRRPKKAFAKLSQVKAITRRLGDRVRRPAVQELARGWKKDPDTLPSSRRSWKSSPWNQSRRCEHVRGVGAHQRADAITCRSFPKRPEIKESLARRRGR